MARTEALVALGLRAVAWGWTARLTRDAAVDESTRFSPFLLGVALVGGVVGGSVVALTALVGMLRHPGADVVGRAALCWVASVVAWSAAISLGFVTLISTP